jgi:predicted transcriptional regulator
MDENSEKNLKAKYNSNIYIRTYSSKHNTMGDSFDLFFRRKPALMLIALKKVSRAKYGSQLAKEVDCTYSHAVKILQTLEEIGLVSFEKKGRIKIIKLTKKGMDVAEHIAAIRKLVA